MDEEEEILGSGQWPSPLFQIELCVLLLSHSGLEACQSQTRSSSCILLIPPFDQICYHCIAGVSSFRCRFYARSRKHSPSGR